MQFRSNVQTARTKSLSEKQRRPPIFRIGIKAQEGVVGILLLVCDIQEDEPLASLVRSRYRELRKDPVWRTTATAPTGFAIRQERKRVIA